ARRMDVVWGETTGVEGQLWLLCPHLFLLYMYKVLRRTLGYCFLKLLLLALLPSG
ncbi:uncharacterized protein A4U43_C02F16940, partial [Asparagus officinalis]